MKKEYIKPETDIVIVELEMTTSILTGSLLETKEGYADNELSSGRRGTWGNRWE